MRRVIFRRAYKMYQPGETASFSESEAARLIPDFAVDANEAEAKAKTEAEAAEKAEADTKVEAEAKTKADAKAPKSGG